MIRALRGDNIEEILEDVVRRETAPKFRDFSYREFEEAFQRCCYGNTRPNIILAEPKTFRFLVHKYLEWFSDAALVRLFPNTFVPVFDGATFVIGPGAWDIGIIYFRGVNNIPLGRLDILDRSSEATIRNAVSTIDSNMVRSALSTDLLEIDLDPNDDVPF